MDLAHIGLHVYADKAAIDDCQLDTFSILVKVRKAKLTNYFSILHVHTTNIEQLNANYHAKMRPDGNHK